MANSNYTKVNTSQLNDLSEVIKKSTTIVLNGLTNYKSGLQSIENSSLLEGTSIDAINEAYNKIVNVYNRFEEYSTLSVDAIKKIVFETESIDQSEANNNQDVISADPLTFGAGVAMSATVTSKSEESSTKSIKTSSNLTGNASTVSNYFQEDMGLNRAATAAIMANMSKESGFNPNSSYTESGGFTSYGLSQWNRGRLQNLKKYCNNNGYDYSSMDGQLHFLEYELKTSYPSVYNKLVSVSDTPEGAYEAAYYYCVHYEVPSNKDTKGNQRGAIAQDYYNQI